MDPQVQALLDMMTAANADAPKLWEQTPQEARATAEAMFGAMNAGAPDLASTVDRTIPGPAGEIPIKVQTPLGDGPFPLLVYIHGGGFVIGSPDSHSRLSALLADGAKAVVVSVHYRLAPEHPAPAALEDCVAAVKWSLANAAELGADVSRFAIGGDSAGGNLTAATCLKLRDTGQRLPDLQYLIYGAFDIDHSKPSYLRNGSGYFLEMDGINWFMKQYLPTEDLRTDPYVWPNHAENLAGLPPAFMQVGTLDPLLDETFVYGNRLALAGVPVDIRVYPDMIHGFLQMDAMLDRAKVAVADGVAAVKAALHPA